MPSRSPPIQEPKLTSLGSSQMGVWGVERSCEPTLAPKGGREDGAPGSCGQPVSQRRDMGSPVSFPHTHAGHPVRAQGKYRGLSTARRTVKLSAASVEMTCAFCGAGRRSFASANEAHLSDDEAVAKMGHPVGLEGRDPTHALHHPTLPHDGTVRRGWGTRFCGTGHLRG